MFRRFGLSIGLAAIAAASAMAQVKFSVSIPKDTLDKPFSGRVVVFLSANSAQPKNGPNWFRPEPMLMMKAENLAPGAAFEVDSSKAITFPKNFATAASGEFNVQAVFDRNLGGRTIGGSPGNIYSKSTRVSIDWSKSQKIDLVCDQVVPERTFTDSNSVKGVKLESKLLSKFYGRPTYLTAAVVLPEGYETDESVRFPTIYSVPGFGGTHWNLSGRESRNGTVRAGQKFLFVSLNPDCPTGHSVFADSANNGPWGKALTEELIPHIESTFRTIPNVGARFVTGHSSGGWSSFWLQVTYPDVFGGCWSTSPDPVDFRDFQQINIYRKGENMFTDPDGKPRPLARRGGSVAILYEAFSDMERPLRGEQLLSFDGVFSPKGANGEPMELWNRVTGEIDPKVAEYWKRYDIGLTLRSKVKSLVPKLKGKMHVYMGNEDTFYLEGATKLVMNDVAALGNPYEAKIEIFPGDHGSVMTAALRERIDREMAESFAAWKARQTDLRVLAMAR